MQIEIDFDVFKALTALRHSEADSYNAVIRRLLDLPTEHSNAELLKAAGVSLGGIREMQSAGRARGGLLGSSDRGAPNGGGSLEGFERHFGGVWFGNVHFPESTKFRATYKGRTFHAEIKNGQWLGDDGIVRTSPSDAASAISNTNVNGWRFWFVQLPGDPAWRKLDELKS